MQDDNLQDKGSLTTPGSTDGLLLESTFEIKEVVQKKYDRVAHDW